MPHKILFFSGMETEDSTGEISQILSFCQNINKEDFSFRIYVKYSSYFQFSLENIDFYYNDSIDEFRNYIDEFKPNIIILSEYPHTPQIFIDYILEKKILLITFDCTGIIRQKNFVSDIIGLKPCPVNLPSINTKYNKYWDIFRDAKFIKNREQVIKNYNLNKNTKIILFSIAPWAYKLSLYYRLENFYGYLFNILVQTLISLNIDITLFFISPIKVQNFKKNNLNIIVSNRFKNSDYRDILNNSDLVMSDNIVQASMAKSFMQGTNTLALINTLDIEQDFIPKFKFNIFPLGYIDFGLPQDYEYYKLINKAEVFDEEDIYNKINYLLNNQVNKSHEFVQKCRMLLSNNEILKEIIEENF